MDCLQTLKYVSLLFLLGCSSAEVLSIKTEVITNSKQDLASSFKMVSFKSGDLILGPRVFIDEGDKKSVRVEGFRILETEVSQLQWVSVMKSNPSKFKTNKDCSNHSALDGVDLCPSNPVESFTYAEVEQFLSKLNSLTNKKYRLPTELEWEHSVSNTHLHNLKLDKDSAIEFALFGNEVKRTVPSKSKKSLENKLYSTGGNVWELTSTSYNKFEYSIISKESHENELVVKGGGWNSRFDHLRRSYRGRWPIDLRSPDIGLRLAL